MKVAFVHPDLGIGGAERLIVDAAVSQKRKEHSVTIFTSHHDPSHCFQETKDGTLDVQIFGDFLPTTIFGYGHVLCAIMSSYWLAWNLVFGTIFGKYSYDLLFVDQISASIPILRLTGAKILFYCHFPDKLLTQRQGMLKRIYRYPFDWFEEFTTGLSDEIVVNSEFTRSVFKESFKRIIYIPKVVYPGINLISYNLKYNESDPHVKPLLSSSDLILSINRFERKKNIGLAIRAFAMLRDENLIPINHYRRCRLVIAGGYDIRVRENVEYLLELEELANYYKLSSHTLFKSDESSQRSIPEATQVIFLPSFSESQRSYLLTKSKCLIYTPSNEHFGIVPIEAMYSKLPVIAINNGGPRESVIHNVTGWLCDHEHSEAQVSAKLANVLMMSEAQREEIGRHGRENVENRFSLEAFTKSLDDVITRMKITT